MEREYVPPMYGSPQGGGAFKINQNILKAPMSPASAMAQAQRRGSGREAFWAHLPRSPSLPQWTMEMLAQLWMWAPTVTRRPTCKGADATSLCRELQLLRAAIAHRTILRPVSPGLQQHDPPFLLPPPCNICITHPAHPPMSPKTTAPYMPRLCKSSTRPEARHASSAHNLHLA